MLCAACGRRATDEFDKCPYCKRSGLLANKYRVDDICVERRNYRSFSAIRTADGIRIILQQVIFRDPDDREAVAILHQHMGRLASLDHPAMPVYIDEFQTFERRVLIQWYAQLHAPGDDLQTVLARSHFDDAAVVRLLFELSDIVDFLHRQRPPVIHRQLTPQAILRDPQGGPLTVVDFGLPVPADPGVPPEIPPNVLAYMAPEQFHGDVRPASDIYALGAVAVHLLTRNDPRNLLDGTGRLNREVFSGLSPTLVDLLDRMLIRNPARRLADGDALRAALQRGFLPSGAPRARRDSPFTAAATAVGRAVRQLPASRPSGLPEWAVGVALMGALGIGLATTVGLGAWLYSLRPTVAERPRLDCYDDLNLLNDGGFEFVAGVGLPRSFGQWSGDASEIVMTSGRVEPREGTAMLAFRATQPRDAGPDRAAQMHQLVDLTPAHDLIADGRARLVACARFNRIGLPHADTRFSLSIRAYDGAPTTFVFAYENADHVHGPYRSDVLTDSDESTWQKNCLDLLWPASLYYAAIEIAAHENVNNDFDDPEFVGHFVDDACLAVVPR